jgi:RNA polymerase sigma factor (sigma-70 family)
VLNKGGTKEDAQDIFQEALIIFCDKCLDPNFTCTASIDSYLYGTSRFLWKNLQRKKGLDVNSSSELNDNDIPENIEEDWDKESQFRLAENAIASLGEKCKDILKFFYIDKRKMEEITKILGFKSANVAKTQKYRCLEKARANYLNLKYTYIR